MAKEESKLPEFNSGIAFLQRIDELKRSYHRSMVVGEYDIAADCLLGIYGELMGRTRGETPKEVKTRKINVMTMQLQPIQGSIYKQQLILFFETINVWINKLELEMPDKKTDDLLSPEETW